MTIPEINVNLEGTKNNTWKSERIGANEADVRFHGHVYVHVEADVGLEVTVDVHRGRVCKEAPRLWVPGKHSTNTASSE